MRTLYDKVINYISEVGDKIKQKAKYGLLLPVAFASGLGLSGCGDNIKHPIIPHPSEDGNVTENQPPYFGRHYVIKSYVTPDNGRELMINIEYGDDKTTSNVIPELIVSSIKDLNLHYIEGKSPLEILAINQPVGPYHFTLRLTDSEGAFTDKDFDGYISEHFFFGFYKSDDEEAIKNNYVWEKDLIRLVQYPAEIASLLASELLGEDITPAQLDAKIIAKEIDPIDLQCANYSDIPDNVKKRFKKLKTYILSADPILKERLLNDSRQLAELHGLYSFEFGNKKTGIRDITEAYISPDEAEEFLNKVVEMGLQWKDLRQ